jgi:hypothetical protein
VMRHVIFWEIHAWKECVLPHACSGGQGVSSVVDIFHATTATWSTAALSDSRGFLVAASLPNEGLAMFAGGNSTTFFVIVVNFTSHNDRLVRGTIFKRCGHLPCDHSNLEHCSSQRASNVSCSNFASESRTRDVCWRCQRQCVV